MKISLAVFTHHRGILGVYDREKCLLRLKYGYFSYKNALEVCTGSKLKPEPGPYPRSSDPTRPDPSGTVKFRARTRPEIPPPPQQITKKKEKGCISRLHAKKRLIKALPFHKHLPVMKVCEHQVQRSHTFCRVYEFCMDKMMTVQIIVIFCQLRLVSILSTLNQT